VGALGLASRGAKAIRPVAEAVRAADDLSQDGGHIAVIPGDPAATRRLREILGSPAAVPSEDALAVAALTAGTDTGAVSESSAATHSNSNSGEQRRGRYTYYGGSIWLFADSGKSGGYP